jgi:hypothetical protein
VPRSSGKKDAISEAVTATGDFLIIASGEKSGVLVKKRALTGGAPLIVIFR